MKMSYDDDYDYEETIVDKLKKISRYVVPVGLTAVTLISLGRMINAIASKPTLIYHYDQRYHNIDYIDIFYDQIKSSNTTLIFPEPYNFEDMKVVLSKIHHPIMLNVYSSVASSEDEPYKLSIEQIEFCIKNYEIKMLRIHEMIGWVGTYSFDRTYVKTVFELCRKHNMPLLLQEWNVNGFNEVKELVKGYEDLVIVSYEITGQIEPLTEFIYLKSNFKLWGSCITSWYWNDKGFGDTENMPIELFLQFYDYAVKNGACVIQFEPYWYFHEAKIDYPTPRDTLNMFLDHIKS